MEQPKGFEEKGKEVWVWELQKGLYGMKQSGRIWNRTMHDAMVKWGFSRLSSEHCLYVRKTEKGTIVMSVYVDDFLITGSSNKDIDDFKRQLRELWTITDLGEAKFCLGIAFSRDRTTSTIQLSQTSLIDRIIATFGQTDAHTVTTPMETGLQLRRPTSPASYEETALPY